MLYYYIVDCIILYYIILYYIMLYYYIILYYIILLYFIIILYYIILYCIILYYIIMHSLDCHVESNPVQHLGLHHSCLEIGPDPMRFSVNATYWLKVPSWKHPIIKWIERKPVKLCIAQVACKMPAFNSGVSWKWNAHSHTTTVPDYHITTTTSLSQPACDMTHCHGQVGQALAKGRFLATT